MALITDIQTYCYFQIRKHDPQSKILLQWDKLFINNQPYSYSEETGGVEPDDKEVRWHLDVREDRAAPGG